MKSNKIKILYFSTEGAEEMSYRLIQDVSPISLLPSSRLVVKPGFYSLWGGVVVHFNKEGLYRVVDIENQKTFQVVVFDKNIEELISAVAKLFLYGTQDDNLRLHEWSRIAVYRHILMQCGPVAISCFKLLTDLGVPCRVVGLCCSEDYFRGHVLNELCVNDKWFLVDFSRKVFIVDENGCKLSLKEIYYNGGFCKCNLVPIDANCLAINSGVDYQFNDQGVIFNSSLYSDFYSMSYPYNLKKWFDEFDIFMLSENPVYEFHVLNNKKNNFQHHPSYTKKYHILKDEEEFFSEFYGK